MKTPITGIWQALLPPFPPTTPLRKGRLVLGPAAHQLEQNKRPFVVAMPAWIHVTVTVAANRRAKPSAYAINTDNASPPMVPTGLGQSTTASGASRTNNAVNRSPIAPAETANARSQPRTVETGLPQSAAVRRDLPAAPAQRGLRLDGRRDHVGGVGPPRCQLHLKEHMRALAARAPGPARPEPAARPIRAEALPNHARPRPPPRTQTATAIGARHAPDQ